MRKAVALALLCFGVLLAQQVIPIFDLGHNRFISLEELRTELGIDVRQRHDFPVLTDPTQTFRYQGELLEVNRNGLLQREGLDYTAANGMISFVDVLQAGEVVTVFWQ